jgi:uncharacterized protein involved in type VI secretion and phage assembly
MSRMEPVVSFAEDRLEQRRQTYLRTTAVQAPSSLYRHAAESTTIVPGTRVLLFHCAVALNQRLAVVASYGTTRTTPWPSGCRHRRCSDGRSWRCGLPSAARLREFDVHRRAVDFEVVVRREPHLFPVRRPIMRLFNATDLRSYRQTVAHRRHLNRVG